MTVETKILKLPEVAKQLGMTEAAIRGHIARRSSAIPMPFKIGIRNAWRQSDVDKWIESRKQLGSF